MARTIYSLALVAVFGMLAIFGQVAGANRGVDAVTVSANVVELAPATVWTAGDDVVRLTEHEAYLWALGLLDGYGLALADGITLHFTDAGNCGSEISAQGTGGGCFSYGSGMIRISPTVVGTESGEIILLHEYAHSVGIKDECAAEAFAHGLFETNLWGYPECSPEWQG